MNASKPILIWLSCACAGVCASVCACVCVPVCGRACFVCVRVGGCMCECVWRECVCSYPSRFAVSMYAMPSSDEDHSSTISAKQTCTGKHMISYIH